MNPRVLVVGGAGYVGGHTAKCLQKRGFDVVIFDNLCNGHKWMARDLPLIVGDIRDSDALKNVLRGSIAVLHFAALAYVGESATEPRRYFDTNVSGSLSLLNAALDVGTENVVFSSTCATYGIPTSLPISDSAIQNPINPYGESKLFIERALTAYSHAYGMRSVSLRYFNAAGADEEGEIGEIHDPETHLIPSIFEAIEGKRPVIEILGTDYPTPDGTCVRDYVHVSDLAEAHVSALEYLIHGGNTVALNLGSGLGNSVLEVIRMVEEVTGTQVPVKACSRRLGDPPILVADPRRAMSVLGWSPTRDLREMVSTAWEWRRSWIENQLCNAASNPRNAPASSGTAFAF